MLIPVLLFIVGLLFLIKGGDWFVDGASALARRFHLPELLIGATVVSIGTTLPEVMVSTMSALSGHGEIAYGNAIGSVICNAALIAAITIAVRPGKVDPKTLKTPVAFFFAAAAIYCAAAYVFGRFTRVMGIIMLAMFVAYMVVNVLQMKNTPAEAHEDAEEEMPLAKTLVLLVLGAVLIALGANLLVDNGTLIAQALGVPESVIALTFVALGTSLPELVTAITSLVKGHSDLSLGNVVGANVFNLVLVSGVSVTLAPFTVPQSATLFGINSSLVLELPVMLAVMLILTVPALCMSGDVCSTLFGSTSILTLTKSEVWLCAVLSVAVVAVFVLCYNKIFAVTFDENFAKAVGTKADLYNLLIAITIAVVIVLAMNLVGSLLISALIIFPALSAMRVYKNFRAVTICAAVLSVCCATLGILISILAGTPVGSTIVAVDIFAFLIFSGISRLGGIRT